MDGYAPWACLAHRNGGSLVHFPPISIAKQNHISSGIGTLENTTYSIDFPDAAKQVILSVPRYDLNWQLGYNVSIKGAEECEAPRRRALRQLGEQPGQARSEQDDLLRIDVVRRDHESILRRRRSRQRQSAERRAQHVSQAGGGGEPATTGCRSTERGVGRRGPAGLQCAEIRRPPRVAFRQRRGRAMPASIAAELCESPMPATA